MEYVNYHNVVLPVPVKDGFEALSFRINEVLGFSIQPADGFKSVPQVIGELRAQIKNPDLTQVKDDSYVINLPPNEFEPPIDGNKQALRDPTGQEVVYTIPNYPNVDPRTTGRIVQIGPKNIINPTLLYFLVHNAGSYGFLHYGPSDPSIWYWRGDLWPFTYTPNQVVTSFSNELAYLL